MRINIDVEVNNCTQCPFKEHIYEQGFCGYICTKTGGTIPKYGILGSCPFLTESTTEVNLLERKR